MWQVNFRKYRLKPETLRPVNFRTKSILLSVKSAIEHLSSDLLFFERAARAASKRGSSFLQIHLFPSAACLALYRGHGVRQYTPRTASLLAKQFLRFSDCRLFTLGGRNCNKLHFQYITHPRVRLGGTDLRREASDEYCAEVHRAVVQDNTQPPHRSGIDASFFALVIYSNPSIELCI